MFWSLVPLYVGLHLFVCHSFVHTSFRNFVLVLSLFSHLFYNVLSSIVQDQNCVSLNVYHPLRVTALIFCGSKNVKTELHTTDMIYGKHTPPPPIPDTQTTSS